MAESAGGEAGLLVSSVAAFFARDEVLGLLLLLSARELAKLRAVCASLRASVDAFTDEIVRVREHRCSEEGAMRLREMARQERAFFFEDFAPGWRERWHDGPTVAGAGGVRYECIEAARLDTPSPRHCLRVRGGGLMNFNGVYHSFSRPIRPRAISLRVRVAERTPRRAFANFFLSAGEAPLKDLAVFYMGRPPQPRDLFSVLVDLATPLPPRIWARPPRPMLGYVWLPSSQVHTLELDESAAAGGGGGQGGGGGSGGRRVWGRVRPAQLGSSWVTLHLSLDWAADQLSVRVDDGLGGVGACAPKPFVVPEIAHGFTHLYLFNWCSGPVGEAGASGEEDSSSTDDESSSADELAQRAPTEGRDTVISGGTPGGTERAASAHAAPASPADASAAAAHSAPAGAGPSSAGGGGRPAAPRPAAVVPEVQWADVWFEGEDAAPTTRRVALTPFIATPFGLAETAEGAAVAGDADSGSMPFSSSDASSGGDEDDDDE